jgi:transcriptional regulator with XRE-family HTH domain
MITPLGKYLEKHGITQTEFAKTLELITGSKGMQPRVSRWAKGKVVPHRFTQAAIEKATRGAVTPRHWARWERAKKKAEAAEAEEPAA